MKEIDIVILNIRIINSEKLNLNFVKNKNIKFKQINK